MVTDDLRNYLREGIKQGYTPEMLSLELIKAGWNSEDVSLAVEELSLVTAPVVVATPAPEPAPLVVNQNPQGVGFQPVASVLTPIVEQHIPDTVTSPYFQTTIPSNTHNYKKIFIILGVALLMLIVAGSAAAYFFILKKDPSPEVVLANMQRAMKDVHSYAFETKVNINLTAVPEGDLLLAANSYLGKGAEGKLNLNTTATGTVVIGDTATTSQIDALYDLAGNASFGAFSVNLDGAMNVRAVDGIAYIRALKFPQLLMMSKVGDAFAPWQDKWIVIDPAATSTLVSSIVAQQNSSTSTMPTTGLTKEEREKMQDIAKKNWPFILTPIEEKNAPMINGIEMYHYGFSLNREKLSALFTEVLAQAQTKQNLKSDPQALKEGIDAAVGILASSTGELMIGKKDSLLYHMNMRLPISIATSSVHLSGVIEVTFDGSQFNAILPIVAPTDATPIGEVSKNITEKMMGETLIKSRDAKRISDIGQIQLALELYFDAHRKYPTALTLLVKEHFLSSMPLDPTDKSQYTYHQLKVGQSYALGASLENEKSPVLSTDADVVDSIVHGGDIASCTAQSGRYCYDVAP